MDNSKKITFNNAFKKTTAILNKYNYAFVFGIILIVYAITTTVNGYNFNLGHIFNIFSSQNSVIVGTMAIGMALVVITGQIDLSLGSSLVLCTGVAITTYNATGGNVFLMILVAIGSGLLCGLINGLLVGLAKMPAFIVTLGTMLIYRSLTLSVVSDLPSELSGSSSNQFVLNSDMPSYEGLHLGFGTGGIQLGKFQLPYIFLLFIAITAIFVFVMACTKYGKRVYAVGSNEKAARLAGINVSGVKISVFVIAGLMVGIASFIQASKMVSVAPATSGTSYEMYAIAAVVLGGISMAGGKGKILGVFFGALSYTAIDFIISNTSLPTDIQNAFQGLVLIAVIFVQTVSPIVKEKIMKYRKRRAQKD